MKRIVVYSFYDVDGIADRYIDYFLSDISKNSDRIVIVSNGKITTETRDVFSKYTSDIIVRENKGFDIWGYKTGLDYIGWKNLEEYDEVVLINNTLMGPVYPFSEMFEEMEKRTELDFWGITKHLKIDFDPFDCNPYGYIPEHVQSSFMAYSKKFIKQKVFQEYWNNLPEINSYEEAIGKHESFFTKHFSSMGFRWDVYVNNDEDKDLTDYLIMVAPRRALEKYRCPVFKRRTFFQNEDYFLNNTAGEQTIELAKYLINFTNYDFDMVLENLIRTCHQYDLVQSLALNYILPSDHTISEKPCESGSALIMHLYYVDLLEDSLHYASSMPDNSDIYITTQNEETANAIKKAFSKLPQHIEVRIIENRGRDVASLIVGCADVIDKYQYICFYHDKKTKQVQPESIGQSFSYKVSESTLATKEFVQNVLYTFDQNKRLGMLSPFEPNHSVFNNTIGKEWGPNFDNTVDIAKKLGIHVPMKEDKPPVAPLGTVFWFRSSAMKKLIDYKWKYDDFPEEPNGIDGTILHAIERVYPFVVQDAGYLPAFLATEKFAAIELTNLRHYIRNYNNLATKFNVYGTNLVSVSILRDRMLNIEHLECLCQEQAQEIQRLISRTSLRTKIRLSIKKATPKFMYGFALKIKRFLFGPHGI